MMLAEACSRPSAASQAKANSSHWVQAVEITTSEFGIVAGKNWHHPHRSPRLSAPASWKAVRRIKLCGAFSRCSARSRWPITIVVAGFCSGCRFSSTAFSPAHPARAGARVAHRKKLHPLHARDLLRGRGHRVTGRRTRPHRDGECKVDLRPGPSLSAHLFPVLPVALG